MLKGRGQRVTSLFPRRSRKRSWRHWPIYITNVPCILSIDFLVKKMIIYTCPCVQHHGSLSFHQTNNLPSLKHCSGCGYLQTSSVCLCTGRDCRLGLRTRSPKSNGGAPRSTSCCPLKRRCCWPIMLLLARIKRLYRKQSCN